MRGPLYGGLGKKAFGCRFVLGLNLLRRRARGAGVSADDEEGNEKDEGCQQSDTEQVSPGLDAMHRGFSSPKTTGEAPR